MHHLAPAVARDRQREADHEQGAAEQQPLHLRPVPPDRATGAQQHADQPEQVAEEDAGERIRSGSPSAASSQGSDHGFSTVGAMSVTTGATIRASVVTAATTTTPSTTGRHRGVSGRPSGKSSRTSGSTKKYGTKPHTAIQAARSASGRSRPGHGVDGRVVARCLVGPDQRRRDQDPADRVARRGADDEGPGHRPRDAQHEVAPQRGLDLGPRREPPRDGGAATQQTTLIVASPAATVGAPLRAGRAARRPVRSSRRRCLPPCAASCHRGAAG